VRVARGRAPRGPRSGPHERAVSRGRARRGLAPRRRRPRLHDGRGGAQLRGRARRHVAARPRSRDVRAAARVEHLPPYLFAELDRAIAAWHGRRFGVELDPDTEVLPVIGSKEGLAHLSVAFIDPGDEALVPDPGYPVYGIGTTLAGGRPVPLTLRPERGYLPD